MYEDQTVFTQLKHTQSLRFLNANEENTEKLEAHLHKPLRCLRRLIFFGVINYKENQVVSFGPVLQVI